VTNPFPDTIQVETLTDDDIDGHILAKSDESLNSSTDDIGLLNNNDDDDDIIINDNNNNTPSITKTEDETGSSSYYKLLYSGGESEIWLILICLFSTKRMQNMTKISFNREEEEEEEEEEERNVPMECGRSLSGYQIKGMLSLP
jgi:hypothetical protein